MSLLNIMTAFFEDCVILINVTLPFKYCPCGRSIENLSDKNPATCSNAELLLLKAKISTLEMSLTFSLVYEHSISVPFSPSIPDTLPWILIDKESTSTKKYR